MSDFSRCRHQCRGEGRGRYVTGVSFRSRWHVVSGTKEFRGVDLLQGGKRRFWGARGRGDGPGGRGGGEPPLQDVPGCRTFHD
jgi:hypothetical protein